MEKLVVVVGVTFNKKFTSNAGKVYYATEFMYRDETGKLQEKKIFTHTPEGKQVNAKLKTVSNGDEVILIMEKRDYWEIIDVLVGGEAPDIPAPKRAQEKISGSDVTQSSFMQQKDDSIARAVALKAAIDYKDYDSPQGVIAIATLFESYLKGNYEAEKAVEEEKKIVDNMIPD
jgi:hypothetical protein